MDVAALGGLVALQDLVALLEPAEQQDIAALGGFVEQLGEG